jgi:hypothetical protein
MPRSASAGASSRKGDMVQCAEGITRCERTRRGRDQRVKLNPATLVTHTIQSATLVYLTTSNQQVVSRTEPRIPKGQNELTKDLTNQNEY